MRKVITIGRQFGSGGRELGKRISDELQIAYYDREIVTQIAERAYVSETYVQKVLEHAPDTYVSLHYGRSFYATTDPVVKQNMAIYRSQHDIICELADKEDCVIVGRCADFILRKENPLRLFVYADDESRIKRCRLKAPEGENLSDGKLVREMRRIDRHRSKYYSYYTGQKWGDPLNYDLCVNTTNTSLRDLAKAVAKLFI